MAILAVAIALIPRLGTEFLPEMNEGDIHITITMPTETSLERGYVPLSVKDYVRDYFSSLDPTK